MILFHVWVSSTPPLLSFSFDLTYTDICAWQNKLACHGHIYLGEHQGWYAVSDEAFYPESQICATKQQSGSSSETVYTSIETGQRVEWTTETNYKFRLSAFQQPLLDWLENNREVIQPSNMYDHVLAEVRSGLQDLSISRLRSRLSWGIPVPGDPQHTMYVWMDALVNYMTALGLSLIHI